MPFTIANLTEHPSAVSRLARWQHAEWAGLNPGDTEEMRAARLHRQTLSSELPQTWVAVAEGVVLGSASLVPNDMDNHPELEPWLASVFVAPEHRRRGIGRALVQRVEMEAERFGYDSLYLFTTDRPQFYASFGWAMIGDELYRGHSVTLMRRDLR